MNKAIPTALLALALAGCGDKGGKEQGGKAEGQILPASVSDAMIPVDQVRSQSPLAPQAGSGKKEDKDKAGEAEAAATDAPAAEETAKAAPSASPTA